MFVWLDGEENEGPYILLNGEKHYVHFPATGETPFSADNMNLAQKELLADMEAEISEEFDVNKNYPKGSFCIKENVVYKANEDIAAGPWDSTQWTATTITDEIKMFSNFALNGGGTYDTTVTNMNDATNVGCYRVGSNITQNLPGGYSAANGILLVFSAYFNDTNIIFQMYINYSGDTYVRTKWFTNWYAWRKIDN